jgi:hypothetical protein
MHGTIMTSAYFIGKKQTAATSGMTAAKQPAVVVTIEKLTIPFGRT